MTSEGVHCHSHLDSVADPGLGGLCKETHTDIVASRGVLAGKRYGRYKHAPGRLSA